MGLTVVTGAANSGKTGVVYDIVRRAVEDDREPVVLVPTAPDARRARLEFSQDAPLGVRVVPAATFLTGQWALWGDGRRIVTPDQRRHGVREVIRRCDTPALAGSARSPGFARFLERLVRELAAYELDALIAEAPLDLEIACLLGDYRSVLAEAGLAEPGEAWRSLGTRQPLYPGPVVVHRFLDLDPGLEAFAVGCAQTNEVVVSLTWVSGRVVTSAVDGLVARLDAVAQRHLPSGTPAGATGPELERVEAGVMAMPKVAPGEGAVLFGQAMGPEAEAALVAREAKALADEFGPAAVAVVLRDAAGRVPLVARALQTQNLPFDLDLVESLTAIPLGSALVDLLQGVAEPGDPRALTAFLATPYAGLGRSIRESLDAKWRRERTSLAGELAGDLVARDVETGRLVERARALVLAGVGTDRLREWKCLLDSLMTCRYGNVPSVGDQAFERDATGHRAAFDAVSSLAEAHVIGTTGPAEVLDALRQARTASRTYERPGRLQVVEAHRIGSRRFEGIVIGGLDDAGFSPLRPSDVVEDTAARMAPIERPDPALHERLLFYNTVTRARRRLVLVRQAADADGVAKRPSPFWDEMLDFFRHPAQGPQPPEAVSVAPMGSSDVAVSAPSFGADRTRLRASVLAGRSPARPLAAARRGFLADELVLAELAGRESFSATELESYVRCPYQWFYQRTTRPEPLDGEVGPMQTGRLVHEVLRTFYEEALPGRLGVRRVDHEHLDQALELLEEVVADVLERPGVLAPATLFEEDQVVQARTRLRGLLMSDVDFLPGAEPVLFEWVFGSQESPVAVADFRIGGRVDRVDDGPGGLAVMDYKLGGVPSSADIKTGRSLQVMLYAHAVQTVLGRPVSRGYYRGLRTSEDLEIVPTDRFQTKGAQGELLEMTYLEAALKAATTAVAGIRSGRIAAEPRTAGSCTYCAAAATCPRRQP